MNFKHRDIVMSLHRHAGSLQNYSNRLMRDMLALTDSFDQAWINADFSEADVEKLINLNERLIEIELYLVNAAANESRLKTRVDDANDPIYDYEIDVQLDFILRDNDPAYDEDDDNILTSRNFSIKHLDGKWSIGDNEDHREPCKQFPGILNDVRHCTLFHDLYNHSYGLDQMALSLNDCCRVGEIWIDIEIKHQASFDVDSGKWRQ